MTFSFHDLSAQSVGVVRTGRTDIAGTRDDPPYPTWVTVDDICRLRKSDTYSDLCDNMGCRYSGKKISSGHKVWKSKSIEVG